LTTSHTAISRHNRRFLYRAFAASIAAHALAAIIKFQAMDPTPPPKPTFTVDLIEAKPPEPIAALAPPTPPVQPPPKVPPPPVKANTLPPVTTAPKVEAAKVEAPKAVVPVVTQEVSPITAAITPAEQKPETPSKPPSPEPPPVAIDTQQLKAEYGALLAQEIAKHKQYPMLAKKTKQQGNVVLQVQITGLGKLIDAQVYQSSGYALLDNQAMDMVKKATPFSQPPSNLGNGDLTLLVPVSFRLN
jgi:protein TonB